MSKSKVLLFGLPTRSVPLRKVAGDALLIDTTVPECGVCQSLQLGQGVHLILPGWSFGGGTPVLLFPGREER